MANEKRLIDANGLFETIHKLSVMVNGLRYGKGFLNDVLKKYREGVLRCIDEAPTVDAVEVVHSKWDTVFYERNGELATYSHICPVCKYHYKNVWNKGYNYCPNCGAKMDGGITDE